ncbi:hypothetical protein HNR46_001534 [Haloferula luteola]|uniref:Lipoprotein n=1 Tax=Haloferula luteola TaxID=595692 RepID=A0A840V9B8_9BACT|nr:hypothetical protein [Haloferula luteola]MBB5351298.1 hypothetical protein [Haloferula luteola]
MRLFTLSVIAFSCLGFNACTSDPDLNPKPKVPPSTSNQLPHNRPVAGQGAGQLGALPMQQRR